MMITKFKTYEEIPTSLADNILTVSGETNIKQVSLEDLPLSSMRGDVPILRST